MVDLVCRESKAEPGSSDSVLAYLHLESVAALPATGRVLGGGLLDLADSSWRRCRGFSYARASLVLQNFVALGFAVLLGCFPAGLLKRGEVQRRYEGGGGCWSPPSRLNGAGRWNGVIGAIPWVATAANSVPVNAGPLLSAPSSFSLLPFFYC